MVGRLILIVALMATTSCATHQLLFPTVIDEYANVRVRIYRSKIRCRVEVITPTETIQTVPSECVTIPHRVQP